jgi:small subunit ribosomal protein S6
MEIEDDVLRYLTLRQDAKMLRHFERNKERTVEGSF